MGIVDRVLDVSAVLAVVALYVVVPKDATTNVETAACLREQVLVRTDADLLPLELSANVLAATMNFAVASSIAAGLSPFRPELAAMRAGRLMLELIGDLVARGESFAFETTLADRGYVRRIAGWQRAGYHVTILFLSLPSADAALRRVRWRVAQGGHAIPDEVIRRRFAAGRANFETLYKPQVDAWALYDSSEDAPVLLDWGENR